MSDVSDWDLVARARTGDMDAFAALVQRYQTPLVHFCLRMTGSLEDAQDLAQDSFIRVYRYLDRLRPDAKFSTVLFGMGRNLTLNYLRDSSRRGRGATTSLTRDDETDQPVVDPAARPDETARLAEIQRLITAALGQISPEHREVLVLREIQGMDYDSIGDIIQCPVGTVKSRIARAREQLRLKLIELGGIDL